jgi:hypothetical protein
MNVNQEHSLCVHTLEEAAAILRCEPGWLEEQARQKAALHAPRTRDRRHDLGASSGEQKRVIVDWLSRWATRDGADAAAARSVPDEYLPGQ